MFNILNGFENIDYNIFFEIKESKITRGHNYTLVKKQSRLDVRKYSFSQRTINVWNNLSTDCVHASSVNMFKKNRQLLYIGSCQKSRAWIPTGPRDLNGTSMTAMITCTCA